jgi:hypothetical protein
MSSPEAPWIQIGCDLRQVSNRYAISSVILYTSALIEK